MASSLTYGYILYCNRLIAHGSAQHNPVNVMTLTKNKSQLWPEVAITSAAQMYTVQRAGQNVAGHVKEMRRSERL